MNINQITKAAASAQSNSVNTSSTSTTDFKKIFAEKLAAAKEAYEATGMTAAEQETYAAGGETALDAREEYISSHSSDSSGSSSGSGDSSSDTEETVTIKKLMPDGSIMVITTQGNQVVDQYRQKPHMVEKPDFSAAPDIINGQEHPATKLVAKRNLLEDLM